MIQYVGMIMKTRKFHCITSQSLFPLEIPEVKIRVDGEKQINM